jgi:hypothetical protein
LQARSYPAWRADETPQGISSCPYLA